MITAAPTTIGETGSVSTGPMLALNGISRKFHKRATRRRLTHECPADRCTAGHPSCAAAPLLQLVQRLLGELLRFGVVASRVQLGGLHSRHLRVRGSGVIPPRGRLIDLGDQLRALERKHRRGQRERYEPNDERQDETRHCLTSLTSTCGTGSRREYIPVWTTGVRTPRRLRRPRGSS